MPEYSDEQKRIDYAFTFKTEAGERVFYDLMDFCGLLKPDSEPAARNVFLYIMAHMMPVSEDRAKFIGREIING
jgi:hypothetical protein